MKGLILIKIGDEIVHSYRLLFVAHNAGGFDSWVVLNSLVKKTTELKLMKSARSLMFLSLRSRVEIVNTVELPQ